MNSSEFSPAGFLRSRDALNQTNSRLVIIDVQEKLLPALPTASLIVHRCQQLIRAAAIFSVPVDVTEQYPQGLGATVPELKEELDAIGVSPLPGKVRFSSAEVLGCGRREPLSDARDQFVLAGMETHVCVLQTALDLLAMGYRVAVVADAVGSRHQNDWEFGLRRMETSGATLVTTESVLFEWAEVAGTPEFKQISQLIRAFDL